MATTYLSRTMEAATNRKICTYSAWVKKCSLTGNQMLFGGGDSTARYGFIDFNSNNELFAQSATSDSTDWALTSTNRYRDVSAWYHVVLTFDSTQAVSTDRVKMYVNGEQITSFSASSYPTLNYDFQWSYTGDTQLVGKYPATASYWDGNMAHVHYVDGTAYTPSTFAETDSTSGIWVPKTSPSVTYGNQGFFLKFASGASGTDSSGNGNDFTVNGTITNIKDTPNNNYATWNPSVYNANPPIFKSGNTEEEGQSDGRYVNTISTLAFPKSGKWYAEFKKIDPSNDKEAIGIADTCLLYTSPSPRDRG